MNNFRPLLAATIESEDQLDNLDYPVVVSPKIDGIRCLIHPELGPVTRKLKPIPNIYIRSILNRPEYKYLDGEIAIGDNLTAPDLFNRTSSGVMSEGGKPDFRFFVFDSFKNPDARYEHRWIKTAPFENFDDLVRCLTCSACHSKEDILQWEHNWRRYEGIMIRSPKGHYKFNRSTLREQILLKFKRFSDEEAVIIGFAPKETNNNILTRDERGYAKRSSHKANQVAEDLLGSLLVRSSTYGEFSIGTGFDDQLRRIIWRNQAEYLGKTVVYKYQKVGIVDKPRFPVFKSFRLD